MPSCQYWYQGHYVQRPGYWLAAQPDWVWVPSHYVWTPRGYIFSDGHWDYPLEDRGVLFAPVYFPPSVYGRSGYSYSPSIVVDLGVLMVNLFTYPRYSHYYFGDYYDDSYLSIGIYPRYEVEQTHTWYDPIYVYDRWHHRRTNLAGRKMSGMITIAAMPTKIFVRPGHIARWKPARPIGCPSSSETNFRMAEPLTVVVASKGTSLKFERMDTKAQQKIATQATAVHTFSYGAQQVGVHVTTTGGSPATHTAPGAGDDYYRAETPCGNFDRSQRAGDDSSRAETPCGNFDRSQRAGDDYYRAKTPCGNFDRSQRAGDDYYRAKTPCGNFDRSQRAGNDNPRAETPRSNVDRAQGAGNDNHRAETLRDTDNRAQRSEGDTN